MGQIGAFNTSREDEGLNYPSPGGWTTVWRTGDHGVPFQPGYYMVPPDRISERQVQDYILYVRDDLGVAKGTFEPMLAGLKFFYVNTLGYEWPLLTKKKSANHARSVCRTFVATRIAAA